MAKTNGLDVVLILRESKSAKEPGRPIFNDMLTMITSGTADAILCWKIDRLTRNPVDGGQLQWLLQKGKIQCIRTFEKTYLPSDNVLLMSIEQAMANQYIRDLSVNIKRGNRAKLEKGGWPNQAPIGYLNDKINKVINIDLVRSPYIIKAFELYSTGSHSFKDISDILYRDGFRIKSGKKVFKGYIQRILMSVFYTGIMKREGKYYPGTHQALISKDMFDKVQKVMNDRGRPRPKKLFFPLRGFLKCANCGCSLTASIKKGHHYYYCTNGKQKCDEHKGYIREKYLYSLVSDLFTKVDFTERKIELMYRAAKEQSGLDTSYLDHALTNLRTEMESLTMKESRLLDTFLAEQTDKKLYDQKVIEIRNERVSLNKKIAELESRNPCATLEPTKKVFLQASRATKEFSDGDDFKKREVVENLLWNLSIKDKKVAQVSFKSPYAAMLKVPKNADFSTLWTLQDSNLPPPHCK